MSALHLDGSSRIYTTTRTETSQHPGARCWRSVLSSLRLRFTDRSGTVLSCLSGRIHLLDRYHDREHGAFDVAASDRRRMGPDNPPRAGSGHPHVAVDVDPISSHSVEIE